MMTAGDMIRKEDRRDYFAGVALGKMVLSVPCPADGYQDTVAKACYDWADAMERARESTGVSRTVA